MAEAVLASAAVSGLVLPRRVGDRIATDGAWVRNFPLGLAYDEPAVELIVAFRYEPMYPEPSSEWLTRLRRRLQRFGRVPPVAALATELQEAEERAARGEPAHWGDMLVRLMRVSVLQNTVLEERLADEKDESIRELAELRRDVVELARAGVGRRRGERLAQAIDERFAAARFPFARDRLLPRITVRGTAGDDSLETGLRNPEPWTLEAKQTLIRRGWDLLDAELAATKLA
jgi:predicted acylesterase/phospholipase RssA